MDTTGRGSWESELPVAQNRREALCLWIMTRETYTHLLISAEFSESL